MEKDMEKGGWNDGHKISKTKAKKIAVRLRQALKDGNVDFNLLFKTLKKIRYKGNFTIESTRGNNPVFTAKKNLNFIKKKLTSFQG